MADINEDANLNTERNARITYLIASLKPVFVAEGMAGIYRCSFQDGQFPPKNRFKIMYALGLLLLFISLFILFMDLPKIINGSGDVMVILDAIPILIILIQYVTTLITTSLLCDKNNIEIISMLADLDNQLVTMNIEETYRRAKGKSKKFIALLVVSHIIITVMEIATDEDVFTLSETLFPPLYFVLMLELVLFCLLIEMLKSRLDIINGYVFKFLIERGKNVINTVFTLSENKEVKETVNMIGHPSDINMKIRDLAMAYDTVGNLCSMVNNLFNFQLFMTLVATFNVIIITIWTSLYYYRSLETNPNALAGVVIWCVSSLLTVAILCLVCERLMSTRKKTKIIVNEVIMDYSLPKTMRVQAKAFMELIEEWELRIMVYDMFSVDITLILKFISVSTTYLIVIIQVFHID